MEPTNVFTTDRAESLAAEVWGLDVRAESLVGFADDNFRLQTDDGRQFVLKISPPGTSEEWILWPALAIALAMIAFSLFSEGLRVALDPKERER